MVRVKDGYRSVGLVDLVRGKLMGIRLGSEGEGLVEREVAVEVGARNEIEREVKLGLMECEVGWLNRLGRVRCCLDWLLYHI
jgi:hypothetical protein